MNDCISSIFLVRSSANVLPNFNDIDSFHYSLIFFGFWTLEYPWKCLQFDMFQPQPLKFFEMFRCEEAHLLCRYEMMKFVMTFTHFNARRKSKRILSRHIQKMNLKTDIDWQLKRKAFFDSSETTFQDIWFVCVWQWKNPLISANGTGVKICKNFDMKL